MGLMEYIKLSEMRGLPRIVSIQNAYNLTDRHFEIGMDEVCFRENVGLIAYSPLAFGQLSGKYIDNPKTRGRMTLFTSDWCCITAVLPYSMRRAVTLSWQGIMA